MDRKLNRLLSEWLQHEKLGRSEAADLALWRVFQRLPQPSPPVGFAARVLAELGITPTGWPLMAPLGARSLAAYRAVLAIGLVLGGLAAAAVPLVTVVALDPARLGLLIQASIGWLADGVGFVARVLALGRAVAGVGHTLAEALVTPGLMAVTAAAALLSLTAFRMLQALVASDRSSYHARTS